MEENDFLDDEYCVSVENRVTSDLGKTEEAVFEVIALNPDTGIEGIREKYGLAPEHVLSVTDGLQSRGLVRQVGEDEFGDCVWEVTELGRVYLLKFVNVMRFDVMEAKLRGQSRKQVSDLERKREAFENAYRQCKALFEDEGGFQ